MFPYNNVQKYVPEIIAAVLVAGSLSACGQALSNKAIYRQEYKPDILAGENQKEQKRNNGNNQEPLLKRTGDGRCMPEITIDGRDVYVNLQNQEAYDVLLGRLGEYSEYKGLTLDLSGADITVCLDKILSECDFEYLDIAGGDVTAENMEELDNVSLRLFVMRDPAMIDKEIFSHISAEHMKIMLDEDYTEIIPIAEMVNDTDKCEDLVVVWEEDGGAGLLGYSVLDDSLKERDFIRSTVSKKEGILKSIYKENDEEYSYTGFEFYEFGRESKICAEFISVKDRATKGEDYFDILEIPYGRIAEIPAEISILPDHRIWMHDVNFDDYKDIVYSRTDHIGKNGYENQVVFLWDENENKYVLCETAPRNFWCISDKEHKKYYFYPDADYGPSIYYIYEYADGYFIRHSLEILHQEDRLVYVYYKEDEWVREIEFYYQKEDNIWHSVREENGVIVEEATSKNIVDIQCAYFPEFTYIWQNRIR